MDPKAFNWKDNIRRCLQVEGKAGTDEEVLRREERMRNVLEAVLHCDAKSNKAIAEGYEGPYDVVTCSFCLDCVHVEALTVATGRISTLVKPGGCFILAVTSVLGENEDPYFFDQIPIAGFKYDGLSPYNFIPPDSLFRNNLSSC